MFAEPKVPKLPKRFIVEIPSRASSRRWDTIDCLETDRMRESNYVSNAESSHEGGTIRFVFNRKGDTRGARFRLMDFFCSYFMPGI
jgi:hypothetical protein